MAWNPPTYADEPGVDPNEMAHCPRCGRQCYPDHLQRLPPGVRQAMGAMPPGRGLRPETQGQDWPEFVCDACRGTVRRKGVATPAQMVAHLGAPADVLRRLDEEEAHWENRRRDSAPRGADVNASPPERWRFS